MEFSKKSIQKLGKRIRDGEESIHDQELLINYRNKFKEPLVNLNNEIGDLVHSLKIKFVLAGRLKRIKSIKRKLRRPNSQSMDLSRMGDIAGTRIILDNLEDQNIVISKLKSFFQIEKINDKRNDLSNYRAVHLLIKNKDNIVMELQIRTLLQQLWADESETYGEQVKQGKFNMKKRKIENYLKNLSDQVMSRETMSQPNIKLSDDDIIMEKKLPFDKKFKFIQDSFSQINTADEKESLFHIIVFDTSTQELINHDIYTMLRKDYAISEFNRINSILDDIKYDIVFINTNMGGKALKVTHPRFFI
jgi:ppGpp synthetase/RelA/SpoT-type nucleotidyltranferase